MKKPAKKPTKTSTKRSPDDKKKIAFDIFEVYSLGGVTIESVCGEFGITARTLWNWIDSDSELSEGYKKSKESASRIGKESIREKAIDGLTRLISGGFVEEEETEEIFGKNGSLVKKIVRKKKRYLAPNPTAVIFALKNSDPANWNDEISLDFGIEDQVFRIGDTEIKFK
jgi:transposase-like protein